MERASRAFLGLPYLNDAAGEGQGIDTDPPSRYDAFDCLTFVEEVLALTLAGRHPPFALHPLVECAHQRQSFGDGENARLLEMLERSRTDAEPAIIRHPYLVR